MKRIRIGEAERDLDSAGATWVREHVEDLRRLGRPVCVEITLHAGSVNMVLSTPGCGPFQGSGQKANRQEEKILALWKKNGLDTENFSAGELFDFIERVDIL
jgi:hypothetical protein